MRLRERKMGVKKIQKRSDTRNHFCAAMRTLIIAHTSVGKKRDLECIANNVFLHI